VILLADFGKSVSWGMNFFKISVNKMATEKEPTQRLDQQ
jgi:hypothetical protein